MRLSERQSSGVTCPVQDAVCAPAVRPKVLEVLEANGIGTGRYISDLLLNIDTTLVRKMARKLGIERRHVTFLGYCPDLRPFLDALDIFALTSRYESFGYVSCGAMAMGKPVVATNVSGVTSW